MSKVLVSILNFHEYEYIETLLNGIYKQNGCSEIYVYIGDIQPSKEEKKIMIDIIKKIDSENINYIEIDENLGYARGNNYIIRKALEDVSVDFILISNSDIEISDDNTFKKLIESLEKSENNVVAGPKIILPNYKQQGPYLKQNPIVYSIKHILPFVWLPFYLIRNKTISNLNEEQIVWRVIGAFMLIKCDKFIEVGLFSEDTFMYWEEDILSVKLEKFGYKTIHNSNITVKHLHDTRKKRNLRSEKYFIDSMKVYFKYLGYSNFVVKLTEISRIIYNNIWYRLYVKMLSILK